MPGPKYIRPPLASTATLLPGAVAAVSPELSVGCDSSGQPADAQEPLAAAESRYSAPAVPGGVGTPVDLVSPPSPRGAVKLFADSATVAGDNVRACTAEQFWSRRYPDIWQCRAMNDADCAHILASKLEKIRSTLTPEERAYVRELAYVLAPRDPYFSFDLLTGLGDFAGLRRLVRMIPHGRHERLKLRVLLLLEAREAAFAVADALPKDDGDLDILVKELNQLIDRHVDSYAARRRLEMGGSFSSFQTASNLIALSGDYDVFIPIARGGLCTGGIADLLGLPTIAMKVHAHDRERPTSRWVDAVVPEQIAGKRVLLLDKDAITGASVMEAVRRLAPYRPAEIGVYLNIGPGKPGLAMVAGTTCEAVRKIEAAGITVHHPENVRRAASKEVIERLEDGVGGTPLTRLRCIERALEDELLSVAQAFAPDEARKLRDALAGRARFFHSLNPSLPGVTEIRGDVVKGLDSLLQIYREGLLVSDGASAVPRDEAGPLAAETVDRYVGARHRLLQLLNRDIVGIVRDMEFLRKLDGELCATDRDKMEIGRRLHAALSAVLPGVVEKLNVLRDVLRDVAVAKENALGLEVIASRERFAFVGREIHPRAAASLQRYAADRQEFYEALEHKLPALAEKCASLLAMQRDLDRASRGRREARMELRANLYTALEELPALADELQSMLTMYREVIAPGASHFLAHVTALAASAPSLPVGFADVMANARYREEGRRRAADRKVTHAHLPRSYTVAFRVAQEAVQEVGYDTALIVGPEGFAYEPIFRDLGLAIVAVNIPEADFGGKRSLKVFDKLSKLKGRRVLVVEDDVVSGATLRALLPSLERHAPAELGLFLGSPSERQLRMNVPATFRRVHISDEKMDADADAFLRHLAEREVIFKDGLPDWWKK